jgi:hypothetical protein
VKNERALQVDSALYFCFTTALLLVVMMLLYYCFTTGGDE